jgi:hypothetical protein
VWERDKQGNTFIDVLITVPSRLRLAGNPAADAQCPEYGAGMKKEILQLHFEECWVKALQAA